MLDQSLQVTISAPARPGPPHPHPASDHPQAGERGSTHLGFCGCSGFVVRKDGRKDGSAWAPGLAGFALLLRAFFLQLFLGSTSLPGRQQCGQSPVSVIPYCPGRRPRELSTNAFNGI